MCPSWGPGPQPRHVPCPGIRTGDPWLYRMTLNQLRHANQIPKKFYIEQRELTLSIKEKDLGNQDLLLVTYLFISDTYLLVT